MAREFVLSFVAFFVAIDVIGMVPLFLGLTRNLDEGARRLVLRQSIVVATTVALLFAIAGTAIFRFLSIGVADFKIAGGIVLLLVSLADLLQGPEGHAASSGSTGIVPLAVPLITGPGVITAGILQVATRGYAVALSALLLNFLIAWFVLAKATIVSKAIGRDGTVIVSKVVALLLAAISVSMIRGGLEDIIRAFNAPA